MRNQEEYHSEDWRSGRIPDKRLGIRKNTTQKMGNQEEYHPKVWIPGRIPPKR